MLSPASRILYQSRASCSSGNLASFSIVIPLLSRQLADGIDAFHALCLLLT